MSEAAAPAGRIVGVILAAGSSSRLGRPKQLLPYRGKPLLQHVLDVAAPVLDEVVVVLGHAAEEIRAALTFPLNARAVHNPDFASGQASSLRAGLTAAGAGTFGAVILLGDQPGIQGSTIRALIDELPRTGARAVRTTYAGRPGHPVLLHHEVWEEVGAAAGDVGARDWISRHPEWVRTLALPFPPPIEVDTEEDYRRLLETE